MEQKSRQTKPRPASTVVLLRPAPQRFEVLLIRRSDDVAFMSGAHVFPGGSVDDADWTRQPYAIAGVPGGHHAAAVRELAEEAGIDLSLDALTPLARWITPEIEIRRFDAWFFVARAPHNQEAQHDTREAVDSVWLDPADAIERGRRGEIALPPPTWTTLRMLERFGSVDEVIAWARTRTIVPVQPEVVTREGVRVLTVPGDPNISFVLEEGRWRPAAPDR